MDKIAVLIPCYNEEMTIYKVVSDFRRILPEAVVYVYDNNSKDRTAEEALRAGAVVRREYKQGKGNVIRRMFREIDAQCYVMTDGDDTYPAKDAPEMSVWFWSGAAIWWWATACPQPTLRKTSVPSTTSATVWCGK